MPPLFSSYATMEIQPDSNLIFHYEQILEYQLDACDLILIETVSNLSEGEAALKVASSTGKPVIIAFCVDDMEPTKLRSGALLSDGITMSRNYPVQALLLNCSRPEAIQQAVSLFDQNIMFGVYPNGFESVTPLQPDTTVDSLKENINFGPEEFTTWSLNMRDHGASYLGGCCRITPAHMRELALRLNEEAQAGA